MGYLDGLTASSYREESGTYYYIAGRKHYRFLSKHDYEQSRARLTTIMGTIFAMVPVLGVSGRHIGYGWVAAASGALSVAFTIWFLVFGQAMLTVNSVPEQGNDSVNDRFDRSARHFGQPVLWAGTIGSALLAAIGVAIYMLDPSSGAMAVAIALFFGLCTIVWAASLWRARHLERERAGGSINQATRSTPAASPLAIADFAGLADETVAPASARVELLSQTSTVRRDPVVPWLVGGVVAAILIVGVTYTWLSRSGGADQVENRQQVADSSSGQSESALDDVEANAGNSGSLELAFGQRHLKVLLRGQPWPSGETFTLGELDDYLGTIDNLKLKQWMSEGGAPTLWVIVQLPDGPAEILFTFAAPLNNSTISVDAISTDGNQRDYPGMVRFAADLAKSMENQRLFKRTAGRTGTAMPVTDFTSGAWSKGASITGHCQVRVGKVQVMDGPCSGKGHGNSIVVGTGHNGCTVELTRSADTVSGKLYAYRDICWLDEPDELQVESDIPLYSMEYSNGCWVNNQARICVRSDLPHQ